MTDINIEPADILDRVLAMELPFREDYLGGGIFGLIATGARGTVVVTDDGDAVLIGFYPGDNWQTGEDQGNDLRTAPVDDDAALRVAILDALALRN